MPAEWTVEKGRRFGVLATVLGVCGVLQAAPVVAPLGAVLIGVLTRDKLREAGIEEIPGTVRAGIYLGVAGMVIFIFVAVLYLLRR